MLNWFEQRQLRAIECCLETDDPVLADRIRNTGPTSSPGNGLRHLSAVAMAGAVLAVVGLVVSPLLAMLGMSVASVAFSLRMALRWVDRERDGERSTPDQDGA
jgi:hypothetical protein